MCFVITLVLKAEYGAWLKLASNNNQIIIKMKCWQETILCSIRTHVMYSGETFLSRLELGGPSSETSNVNGPLFKRYYTCVIMSHPLYYRRYELSQRICYIVISITVIILQQLKITSNACELLFFSILRIALGAGRSRFPNGCVGCVSV